eukprot:761104-Hanusia_phi.AAC.1
MISYKELNNKYYLASNIEFRHALCNTNLFPRTDTETSNPALRDVNIQKNSETNQQQSNSLQSSIYQPQKRSSITENCPSLLQLATHHDEPNQQNHTRCGPFILQKSSLTVGNILAKGSSGE